MCLKSLLWHHHCVHLCICFNHLTSLSASLFFQSILLQFLINTCTWLLRLSLASLRQTHTPTSATQTQSVSILHLSLQHCSGRETELSMPSADAACGWSEVGTRRRERVREWERGWEAERQSDGAGMLQLRQVKQLHGKIGHWQHRRSDRGGSERPGFEVDVTKEKICDQVKTSSQRG